VLRTNWDDQTEVIHDGLRDRRISAYKRRSSPRVVARRGRPPTTSARDLQLLSLWLFTEQGYEETAIDQIASAAGVQRRTFFN
jgi:hypothetical protein